MKPLLMLFNHILHQHPQIRARLQTLSGRRVALATPFMTISGVVTEAGWLAESQGEPEACIHIAPMAALRAQLFDRAPAFSELTLAGDPELAQQFASLISSLRYLPVEDLSRVLGDVLAHRVERVANSVLSGHEQIRSRVLDNWGEHIREEAPLLVGKRLMEPFITAVDQLRDDVARLEKRIQRLEAGSVRHTGRIQVVGSGTDNDAN